MLHAKECELDPVSDETLHESKHEVMLSDLCLRKFTPAVENELGCVR